jgi:hypothetical protein
MLCTSRLIQDEKLLQKFSQGAIERSKYFSRKNFKKRFERIIEK